jgi:hypothetical protein
MVIEPGRATAAIFDIPGMHHVMCVTVYGNTYSPENTISIMEKVISHCYGAQLPFIIGGDFNLPPEELHSKLCDTPIAHQEIQIIAPHETTCTTANGESTLDYWIIGGGAQLYAQAVTVDHTVPVKPHSAVSLHLRTHGGKLPIGQVWRRPWKGSSTQVIGPQREIEVDWTSFDKAAAALGDIIQGIPAEALLSTSSQPDLDKALEDTWQSFQTAYFVQAQSRFMLDDNTGKPFKIVDLKGAEPHLLSHRPNIYRYLSWQRKHIMRATSFPLSACTRTLLGKLPHMEPSLPLTEAMRDWHLQWQAWWQSLSQVLLHPKYTGHLAQPLRDFNTLLQAWEDKGYGHARAIQKDGIKQWKDTLFSGAGTKVHAWSKKSKMHLIQQVQTPCGALSSSPLHILQHTVSTWKHIWHAVEEPPTTSLHFPATEKTSLPPITTQDITLIRNKFKSGTSVPDGWHPAHFARTTNEQDLQRFATMLNLVEAARRMPPTAKPCMVKMLPKPKGGHRPIALFRSLYRAWGKVRNPILARWALHLQTQVFTMSPTRRITDVLYREICRSLIKQTNHSHIIEIHCDIRKYFDHIRRIPLVEVANMTGYPMALLQVSLDIYAAPRRIVLDSGLTSQALYGQDGILAGSPHAVFETAAYMGAMAKSFVQLFPSPHYHMTLFVDDLALQVSHDSRTQCLERFAQATVWVITELQETLGLPIEQDKTFMLGSSADIVAAAHKMAGAYGGNQAAEVRKLGATYSHQHRQTQGRRCRGVVKGSLTKARVAKALHRARRVKALAGSRAHGAVFHTGMLQEATFGASVSLMPHTLIGKLRSAAVRANGLHIAGVKTQVSLLAMPVDSDPQWHIDRLVLDTFAREIWNGDRKPQIDHLTKKEIGLLFGLEPPPEYKCFDTAWKDPIATLHYTLRRLGISWARPTIWTHHGQELNLNCGTPALLMRMLKPAFRRAQVKEANFPGADEDWDPTYLHHVLDSTGTKRSLSRYGKQALLAFMVDRYPTRTTFARWGYITDGMCPHCGNQDTAYHRIHTCDKATMKPIMDKHLRRWRDQDGVARGILKLKPPPIPEYDHRVKYTLFGAEVTREQFGRFMSADGPVYTDGSTLHGRTPYAVGGWAALQVVNGRISRSISAPNPPDYPPTSDFSEHIAVHIALMHASDDDPLHFVTDCASVILYHQQALKGTANAAANVLGGIWDDIELHRIDSIDKIKSHLTFAQACERNMGQWWHGNQLADNLAQAAARRASVSTGEAVSYTKQLRWAEQYLRDIAQALLSWKGETTHLRDFQKPLTSSKKSALPPHKYEWCHIEQAWICSACWKHRGLDKLAVPDKTGCKAIPVADVRRLHTSHDLRFAQGPWGAKPLIFCLKCGHYTRRRLADLGGWCKGAHTASGALTSAYRLYMRTIKRGLHPTLARFALGHVYKPHISFAPASDQGSLAADQKAAKICLLCPPAQADLPLDYELKELLALEQEAKEAENSRLREEAFEDQEEGLWLSQSLDSFDP